MQIALIFPGKSGVKTANTFGRQFFYNNKSKIIAAQNPLVYYGYTDWSRDREGFITYMPSVRVPDLNYVPEGMTGITVPSHKYVIFKFVGFFNPDDINGRHVGRLLVQLYRKWIINSGYRFADAFRFEYIDTSVSKDHYCELYLYQPILDA
jgi:AraC family transcriptional regulator